MAAPYAAKCLAQAIIASVFPNPFPWKPVTLAAAMTDPRYGSSPAPSITLPHRGSRAMSTIGANVQCTPAAAASVAAILADNLIADVSQLDASANGIGNIVL